MSSEEGYVLKFISGKYQGGEFPLEMDTEIIIGRSSELDMVLVEDMVSRRHARITSFHGQLVIEDFGSTNGSFVNGERISAPHPLKGGDRILIGTNIIKLVPKGAVDEEDADDTPPEGSPRIDFQSEHTPSEAFNATRTHIISATDLQMRNPGSFHTAPPRQTAMSVDLREIPLPDLLQLFSTGRRTGTVLVESMDTGRIYLREGRVIYAVINDDTDVSAYKAFYRILQWSEGHCVFERNEPPTFENEINESIEGLMMEGMRQKDEIENLGPDVPSVNATLFIHQPLEAKLTALAPEQLDVFQMVFNHGRVSTILNRTEESDIEIFRHLLHLIRNDYIHAE